MNELNNELETLRMQLAACGVAALCNTKSSSIDRIGRDNLYWSASYQDVCNAVDREIALREKCLAYESALQKIVDSQEPWEEQRTVALEALNNDE